MKGGEKRIMDMRRSQSEKMGLTDGLWVMKAAMHMGEYETWA